jgi:chromate reductase
MNRQTPILGISGSLRHESYNSAAQGAAAGLAPEGAAVQTLELDGKHLFKQDSFDIGLLRCVFHLDDIPLFKQDGEKNPPRKNNEESCS